MSSNNEEIINTYLSFALTDVLLYVSNYCAENIVQQGELGEFI
jgi:hypothetical protein